MKGGNSRNTVRLGEMRKGAKGIISGFEGEGNYSSSLIRRLLDLGLLEGTVVEIAHEAPFGGDPVAVKVRGTLLALRRHEANAIEVNLVEVGIKDAEPVS